MSSEMDAEPSDNDNKDDSQVKESEVVEILSGFTNFDDFVNAGFEALKTGIKVANSLPSGQKYDYYNCFPNFRDIVNGEMKNVLEYMQNVIDVAGARGNIKRRDNEEKFELLVEANDILLERAGICMDEVSGIRRNPEIDLVIPHNNSTPVSGSWNNFSSRSSPQQSKVTNNTPPIHLLMAKNVERPQCKFEERIDNSDTPWQPRIKDKPNSLKPLALFMEEDQDGEYFSHPYEFELDRFKVPEHQLKRHDTIAYKPLEDSPLVVIENPEDLKIILDDLQKYTEIAVDLEHHSYRSYMGITCLMQISTRDTDYIIDTLSLRSELHMLNEIFTKPTILKVFHGATNDIEWLQRDLSLYIVNMFDTHVAAKQLDFPYLSLAYLMKQFCRVDPNKHFQLADWRIRPLSEELLKYAREDTHYLLYIKDTLTNALIEQANGQSNILKAVYDRSTDICKKTYRKPVWSEESYMKMYRKSRKLFNNRQLYALKELHKWRDTIGRTEDESIGYILPNHMLLNIAESLPREMQGILACCNPIPPLVRQNLLWLHKIILKAREQPLIKPILEDDIRQRMTQRNQVTDPETSALYSPHDMPYGMEVRADLPCLLDPDSSVNDSLAESNVPHCVTVFDSPLQSEDEDTEEPSMRKNKRRTPFVSPFERYKRVLPMVAAEEAKERERQMKEEAERLKSSMDSEKEITESKTRVYEHFKKISTAVTSPVSAQELNNAGPERPVKSEKQKPTQKPLSQMQGRKRKRQSNYDEVEPVVPEVDLSTPVPSLRNKTPKNYKPNKTETQQHTQNTSKNKISTSHRTAGHSSHAEDDAESSIERIRPTNWKDRRAMRKNMQGHGMLPKESFDYRNIDFSSFQGGSRAHNQAPFQAQNHKKNIRGNRGKGNRSKRKQK